MTDKWPHIKPEELAGLIRQYLAGELDDKAMHALERQALNDPFLADAIEGYAAHTPEQTVHQEDLASRLSNRIAPRSVRVRPMYYRWAAAAAILLLMFSAGWFLWEQQRKQPIAGVSVPKTTPEAAPALSEHGDTATSKARNDQLAENIPPPAPAMDKKSPSKAAREKEVSPVLSAQPASKEVATDKRRTTSDDTVTPTNAPVTLAAKPRAQEEAAAYAIPPATSAKDSPPLGRKQQNVFMPDSQKGHLNEVIVVGYGAQKKETAAGSVIRIRGQALPDRPVSSLDSALQGRVAGVSVAPSANTDISEEMAYRAPAPVTGMTAFENYLKTKTINPDNKYNGTVRVSFLVMPDGSLQDFRILRHLNEACDAEAIRVIKEGPAWAPASDRKPTKVKVRVKFTVEK